MYAFSPHVHAMHMKIVPFVPLVLGTNGTSSTNNFLILTNFNLFCNFLHNSVLQRKEMLMKLFQKTKIMTEEDLIQNAKKSAQHFGLLYEKYHHRIFLFVLKRLETEEEADDITSKVFVKAFLNIHKFEYKGHSISSWLFRIAINECNQYFRRLKKERVISIGSEGIEQIKVEIQINREEELQALAGALSELNEEELNLVELRFFEGLSFKEVAEAMGIKENNAKVKTFRTIAKLRKFMAV